MRIEAAAIDRWAATAEAQRLLPALVRRLILADEGVTAIDMPAGDSVSRPGWDGKVECGPGSPWTPAGSSVWELSCQGDPARKAKADLDKRTRQTLAEEQSGKTLVLLTARKWTGKGDWLATLEDRGAWARILVYDADDLEQWLERQPTVALWLADRFGLTGPGVESLACFWEGWAEQSAPPITPAALATGRDATAKAFVTRMRRRVLEGGAAVVTLRADSALEGAAFCAAALLAEPDISARALVVTHPDGWRIVEQNPSVAVAIAAAPELAEHPARRPGLVVVIPYAAGDMSRQYGGPAGADGPELMLDRADQGNFERALDGLGLERGDARRLAVSTGRSWSVFRRHVAVNPVLRAPAWLAAPQAPALSTLCLLGSWSASHAGDRALVETVAGRPFAEIESDLRALAQLDDAPVLSIGAVWKAKAPIELLDLFGSRITDAELSRFFVEARTLLATPDPEVDHPPDQLFRTYERTHSGLLLEAVCDTLSKLAVRGADVVGLADRVEGAIEALVGALLQGADEHAWLSLADRLPALAEAAPDAFLRAVQTSLRQQGAPVTALLARTGVSGLTGKCWHAGLLWGLEGLAWDPRRLTRVALILAALVDIPIAGNWTNSPFNSLVGLFRTWIPQTAAKLDQRIAALDKLAIETPDVAWRVLDALVTDNRYQISFPAHRPHWRDDDAGAGGGASGQEIQDMLLAAADRQLAMAEGHSGRIADLVRKIGIFDGPRIESVLALALAFDAPEAPAAGRQNLRQAARDQLSRGDYLRSDERDDGLDLTAPLSELYARLAPADLVARHAWLFTERWPHLPEPERDHRRRFEAIAQLRREALDEIHAELGLDGIAALARACPDQDTVGWSLAGLPLPDETLAAWTAPLAGDLSRDDPMAAMTQGLLRGRSGETGEALLVSMLAAGRGLGWDDERVARLLSLARDERATWDLALAQGQAVDDAYWRLCQPLSWLREDGPDFDHALARLLGARRARSALGLILGEMADIPVETVARILEQILEGDESDGTLLDGSRVGDALSRLDDGGVEESRVVRLQFAMLPALGYEREHLTKTLFGAVMSQPELFVELLRLCYRRRHGPGEDAEAEQRPEASDEAIQSAWRILHQARHQPGQRPDGSIDPDLFATFVTRTRELAGQAGRLEVCDSTVGQILARGPADLDGVWPCGPVRDLLDAPEAEGLRAGFEIGVFNKRGVTSRAYNEGGSQERDLARTYRDQASALHNSHPYLAASLERIARSYDRDGGREDMAARLRIEGH